MTKQQRYQERHKKLGLCVNCSQKAVRGGQYCLRHLIAVRENQRRRLQNKRRNTNAYSYRVERGEL